MSGIIKVAMICHFSNKEVREHLPLDNRRLYSFIRKIMGLPSQKSIHPDIAIWDSFLIQCCEERNDIELHVISACNGLKKKVVSFEINNIHYNFVRCDEATFLKHVIPNDNLWRALNPMTKIIRKLVYTINPDLVLLMGTENSYYSSSVLSITNYPIYVLCQTVYNNPQFGELDSKNASTELKILTKEKYLGVYSRKHYLLLKNLGYDKYIFKFQFPIPKEPPFTPTPQSVKEFDFINFAMQMSDQKGYHDCIKALAIVKKRYPKVKLNLIDGGPETVRNELMALIDSLSLNDNVVFTPFFAEVNDLLQHLQKVRFAVLPCKVDYYSGTQLQSMEQGLPLVCYKTEGTPSLNDRAESVLIAEMNNIQDLADKMLQLLDNPKLADQLKTNAKKYIADRYEKSQKNMPNLIDNFKAILANYHQGAPIPVSQLYIES